MRIPFAWLRTFTPVAADATETADKLTMRGLEVEAVEQITPLFRKVYVGEVKEIEKHPSADKLFLCRVDAGSGILPIVCGAPNVAKGQKVAVALPGALLAEGIAVEAKPVRGVESFGMLCSEKELGLSDDHRGIFVLPSDARPGEALEGLLEITDSVLDVNVPPNRGDCQSVLGIAREVASIFGLPVTVPAVSLAEEGQIAGRIGLSVLDIEACPRYVLRMIEGISIVPAPFWMRSRISKCAMRPINSIVDVTNYVMLELGQPLHAFDYARIGSKRIEVRKAKGAMVFRTLDGQDRRLEEGDILICDGSGPVALAGVMGGENSEISETTRDVALESAFFNPLLIRRTARRLDLRSEASARFEKGIDMENAGYAADRAIDLMQRISGGRVLKGAIEVYERQEARTIRLGIEKTREIIGIPLPRREIEEALESLGCAPREAGGETLSFSIPSFRHDLVEAFDLIEEVARVVGYDRIPASAPESPLLPVSMDKADAALASSKDYLTACGFFEVINYAFFSEKDIERFHIEAPDERASCLPILNPLSKELGVMRTFLVAGVLETLAFNLNRGTKNLRVFEIGKVFVKTDGADLPRESMHLSCGVIGKEADYFWREQPGELDFFDLKGVLEGLFARFDLPLEVRPTEEPFLERSRSADLMVGAARIGWIGEVTQDVRAAYDVAERAWCAEVDLGLIMEKGEGARTYAPVPRYPAVVRDFSFYVDDEIPVADLMRAIREVSPLITSVGIFDVFKKETRSISFRVVFQSFEDTLTDEHVNKIQRVIIDRLTQRSGIRLRT